MDLKLPHLGEGADSGIVVNLFVKEGDQIARDQAILELENEKAVATIPSTEAGIVAKVYVKAGDKISVGQSILSLKGSETAKAPKKDKAAPEGKTEPRPTGGAEEPVERREKSESKPEADEEPERESKPGIEPAASPSIRKLARDLGIDLTRVRGSERGGRIVLEDLRGYIRQLQQLAAQPKTGAPAPALAAKAALEPIDFSKWGAVSRKPLSPLRQVIARRMSENWRAVPRVTQFDEADITGLMALQKKYAAAYAQKGARL